MGTGTAGKTGRFIRLDQETVGRLRPTELAVYVALCAFADGKNRSCFPSYATLARRAGCSRRTAIRAVSGLEKLGLARRQRSETDRRVIYVCATEKYNALRAKAATDVSGYFSSLLSGMSQEDRAMIAAAFQKLDDALLQAGTEQSGP